MNRTCLMPALAAVLFFSQVNSGLGVLPDGISNSQKEDENPLSPRESLAKITVPEGFHVTLFAGEPNVAQPIAMAIDDRGRLWVAECYSYKKWQRTGKDRILIFEDTDGDGQFDRRKFFAEDLANLSGLELGFGGVWVCCAPDLLFIPDRDRDDRPDGSPEVKLTGWDIKKAGHNIVNGLTWGPDGWLYGCQGIQGQSVVGVPGEEHRTPINCGIWRYHPVRKTFEVVAHGTTNPWGLDFNEHGEGFFANCVIGHLWHLIPGAHYKRMYGQDFNPHAYELLSECSDHLHWGGGKWTDSRGGEGKHSEAGGGHAHVGAMVYLGDNWPDKYRGTLFTCNLHGNRVNNDLLERRGSGYVGRHGKDFLFGNDPWFRGLELKYGPDGGVFVSDWCDYGECHDNDGVHRSSGRIYKVVYGQPNEIEKDLNLATKSDIELVQLQTHKNDFFRRRARRILQERAAAGRDMTDARREIVARRAQPDLNTADRLNLLWTTNVIGGLDESRLLEVADESDEHLRAWAIRLLVDDPSSISDRVAKEFKNTASLDKSPLVRLHLASALQRLKPSQAWSIAEALVAHEADADDQNLPLMIWYGIERLIPEDKNRAIALAAKTKIPLVRQFIARRLAGQ